MATPPYTEFDVVALPAETGRWAAGTVGTVIEEAMLPETPPRPIS